MTFIFPFLSLSFTFKDCISITSLPIENGVSLLVPQAMGGYDVVLDIKAALLKRALGFEYEERKGIKKGDGMANVEIYKRYMPPDTTAAAMLLRNYDKEWRDKDNITSDLKQQEMELRKAIAEANNFDLELN